MSLPTRNAWYGDLEDRCWDRAGESCFWQAADFASKSAASPGDRAKGLLDVCLRFVDWGPGFFRRLCEAAKASEKARRYADLLEYLRLCLELTEKDDFKRLLKLTWQLQFGSSRSSESFLPGWFYEIVQARREVARLVELPLLRDLISGVKDERILAEVRFTVSWLQYLEGKGNADNLKRLAKALVAVSRSRHTIFILGAAADSVSDRDLRKYLLGLLHAARGDKVPPSACGCLSPIVEAHTTSDRQALEGFVRHPYWVVRMGCAENPNLPTEFLHLLAGDENREVVKALLKRQDLPPDVRRRALMTLGYPVQDSAERTRADTPRRRPVPEETGSSRQFLAAREYLLKRIASLLAWHIGAMSFPVPPRFVPPRPSDSARIVWMLRVFWNKAMEMIRNPKYGIPEGRWLSRIEPAVLLRSGFLALHVRERPGGYFCTAFRKDGEKTCFWVLREDCIPDFDGQTVHDAGVLVLALLKVHAACLIADLVTYHAALVAGVYGLGSRRGISVSGDAGKTRVVSVPRRRRNGRSCNRKGGSTAPPGGYVPWHFRKLLPGYKASSQALANAMLYAGITCLEKGTTFVRPYWRGEENPAGCVVVSSLARSFAASLDALW